MSIWVFSVSVDFGLQVAGWLLSVLLGSEIIYDLLGSITFIIVSLGSYCLYGIGSGVGLLATTLVVAWAARLGSFLFYRILQTGHDSRFEKIRSNPISFFAAWMMQGVWILATLTPVLLVNSSPSHKTSLTGVQMAQVLLGCAVWTVGFVIESVADYQKFAFKSLSENAGMFIQSGVWSLCRYPNYFGEMTVWWGMYLICTAQSNVVMCGISLISPVFVMLLLCYVSGIPLQEKQAWQRWGDDDDYLAYKSNTNLLIPSIFSTNMICCSKRQ